MLSDGWMPTIRDGLKQRARINGICDLPGSLRERISKDGKEGLSSVERQLIDSTGFSDENYQKLMYQRFKADEV